MPSLCQALWFFKETPNRCGPCVNGAYGLAAETHVIYNIIQNVPWLQRWRQSKPACNAGGSNSGGANAGSEGAKGLAILKSKEVFLS